MEHVVSQIQQCGVVLGVLADYVVTQSEQVEVKDSQVGVGVISKAFDYAAWAQ